MSQHDILLIEDSDEDYEVLQWIFDEKQIPHSLIRFDNGDDGLAYLKSAKSLPSIILMDLNLYGINGYEILQTIKADDVLRRIPVIMLTTSSSEQDINACYDAGASSYLVKMVDLDRYLISVETLVHYWFDINRLPVQPSDTR